jgi:hypothetical protein
MRRGKEVTEVADIDEVVLWRVRAFVYRRFAEDARPPTVAQVAAEFGLGTEDAARVFCELDRRHAFFLDPGTLNIRIANPFSAVRTAFRVHANGRAYFANCAWDALGIPAALHADATIDAACAESGESLPLIVAGGRVAPATSFAHFLVPFRRWYDDMVFT